MTTVCPYCRKVNDCASELEGRSLGEANVVAPPVGAASICIDCGGVAIFDGTREGLRLPNPTERRELHADPDVVRAVRAVKALRR